MGDRDGDAMSNVGEVASLHDSEGVRKVHLLESVGEDESGGCDQATDAEHTGERLTFSIAITATRVTIAG